MGCSWGQFCCKRTRVVFTLLLSTLISFSAHWRFETEFLKVLRPSALYIIYNQKEHPLFVEDFAPPDCEASNLIATAYYVGKREQLRRLCRHNTRLIHTGVVCKCLWQSNRCEAASQAGTKHWYWCTHWLYLLQLWRLWAGVAQYHWLYNGTRG